MTRPAIAGSCHCGAIRFELRTRPEWLTRCNCSLCRRIGGLWGAAELGDVVIHAEPRALNAYAQGDKTLSLHACRTCGCTTHYTPTDPGVTRMKVNLSLADPAALAGIPIRHFDGADTWTYLD